jgi:hypothetical protein
MDAEREKQLPRPTGSIERQHQGLRHQANRPGRPANTVRPSACGRRAEYDRAPL